MHASLPANDPAPDARRGALGASRAVWSFDTTQRGLPLAVKVATEKYSPAYVVRAAEMKTMLAATRLAAKLDPRLAGLHVARPDVDAAKKHAASYVPPETMVAVPRVDTYRALFDALPLPAYVDVCDDDAFFAWQRLAGPNATHVRRERAPDPRSALGETHYARAVGAGDSLQRARGEGRVYALDLTALEGIATGATQGVKRYCDGPLAHFARTLDGRFVPVGIQRSVRVADVVTPADGARWKLARVAVQVADAVWAGAVMHLGVCHSLAGAVQVCTARELAPQHPLYLLLWPHFEMTTTANETMKTDVIGTGGYFDELLAPTREASIDLAVGVLRTRSMRDAAPWRDLALRGCDDTSALPEYPYRDDGLPIAHALRKWVDAYVRLYYASDADLAHDAELVAWHAALGASDGAALHDLPALGTVSSLVDLVTTVIFQVTAGHAVVNYAGYDHYGWPATYPAALWRDPHAEHDGEGPLGSLAPLGVADRMLDLTLPQRMLRMNTLGEYPRGWFGDPRVKSLAEALQGELAEIGTRTRARDEGRTFRFPYLVPSMVAQSIHV